jgi:hypothetical protein
MERANKLVCAVAIALLGLAGCEHLPSWGSNIGAALFEAAAPALTFTALAADGHIYYSASVETTSLSLQNLLQALNLPVTVTKDSSGNVRIASTLPDGTRFSMLMQSSGPRTRVAMEWDNPLDSKRGMQVLVDLETQNKQKLPKKS